MERDEDSPSSPCAGVRPRWARAGSGERYAGRRFASARAAERDVRIVERLLAQHAHARGGVSVLDAPCGAGRLLAMLARFGPVVGADLSPAMLAEAAGRSPRLVRAPLERLPFRDSTFDAVVCCRLLHHLRASAELERAVRELVRVSSRLVIASFWDAGSLPALRVRLGLKRDEGPRGRGAIARGRLEQVFLQAGAEVVGYAGSLRFVAQQTFVVARKRAGAGA